MYGIGAGVARGRIEDHDATPGAPTCYLIKMSRPVDAAPAVDERSRQTEGEPLEPYAWEGDDDHVIFWMLSLTPTQRVEAAQDFVKGVLMIRNGIRS